MGRKIAHFDILDSTNNKARELAENGEPEGTIVIAEEQVSGKGRKGRKWFSQNRLGIWVSIILRPNVELSKVPLITMTA
ncbi:MAG TPA: biotin--[acetyl-CoA-carboxylase] ligase, partial [Ruminiclostridium sp.]|nr:biotin--[acetyl-CoA-carboxylase] ligase [Ruminiclostridium sp.]